MCVNDLGRDIELLARYLPPYGKIITYVCSHLKGPTDIRFVRSMSNLELDMVNDMVKFCVAFWIEMFLFFRCRKALCLPCTDVNKI